VGVAWDDVSDTHGPWLGIVGQVIMKKLEFATQVLRDSVHGVCVPEQLGFLASDDVEQPIFQVIRKLFPNEPCPLFLTCFRLLAFQDIVALGENSAHGILKSAKLRAAPTVVSAHSRKVNVSFASQRTKRATTSSRLLLKRITSKVQVLTCCPTTRLVGPYVVWNLTRRKTLMVFLLGKPKIEKRAQTLAQAVVQVCRRIMA
jgi:hypothetical protein